MKIKPHQSILLVSDVFLINLVFILTAWFQYQSGIMNQTIQSFPYHFTPFFLLASLLTVIFFHWSHLYKFQFFTKQFEQLIHIVKSFGFSAIGIIFIAFLMKHELLIQRLTLGISYAVLCPVFFIYRCLLLSFVYRTVTGSGDRKKKIIIVGAGKKGQEICKKINTKKNSYLSAIGYLDDKEQYQKRFFQDIPVLGRIGDIDKVDKINRIDEILITIENISHDRLLHVIKTCLKIRKPILVLSELYTIIPNLLEVEKFDGIPAFRVKTPSSRLFYYAIKRLFDFVLALLMLIFLSPFILLISILIKLDSKGPAIYKRKVVGRNEKVFTFYKFRTMFHNSDDAEHQKYVTELINGNGKNNGNSREPVYKIKNDPRITRVGKYLRKYSLDELPQLFNVLKGEMSLIGPRPCTTEEFENYKQWHKERFTITPGITGLYQVTARSSVNYDDMVVLDLYYKENQSFWLDLEILTKTIPTMALGKGAY